MEFEVSMNLSADFIARLTRNPHSYQALIYASACIARATGNL